MKPWLLVPLLIGLSQPASALPSSPPVVSFAMGPADQAKPLVGELEQMLRDTRRFVIGPSVPPVALDQALDVTVNRLRKQVKSDWVFAGTVTVSEKRGLELAGRLYDLKLGDASKPLRFAGSSADTAGLARQLTLFLKSLSPLHGEILGLRDNRVLINLGSEDGIERGSLFRVSRKPGQEASEVGTIRVTAADAWFATAEIVSRRKEARLVPGDAVREDVGHGLIR